MQRMISLIAARTAIVLGGCQRTPATTNVLRETGDQAQNIIAGANERIENFSERAGNVLENGFHAGMNEVRDMGRRIGGSDGNAAEGNASRNETKR